MHNERHNSDFRYYAVRRQSVLTRIRELTCYLAQLEQAVKAMPSDNAAAGYVDLDNIDQLRGDLDEAIETLCDWDALDMEFCRLGLPAA